MLQKQSLLFIGLLLSFMQIQAQTRSTFSLNVGSVRLFNERLTPYHFKGWGSNLYFGTEKDMKKNWKALNQVDIAFMSTSITNSFSSQVAYVSSIWGINLNVKQAYVKQIFKHNRFSAFAGLEANPQLCFQILSSVDDILDTKTFISTGLSVGATAHLIYKWDKVRLSNTSSYLLLSALLYPNSSQHNPLVSSGGVSEFFTLSTVNKRNYMTNRLEMELPLLVNKKTVTNMVLAHHFLYEYSTIKDNVFENIRQGISVGVVFKISKWTGE